MSRKTLKDYIALEGRVEGVSRSKTSESRSYTSLKEDYNTKLLELVLNKIEEVYEKVNELKSRVEAIESKLETIERAIERQKKTYAQERSGSTSSVIKSVMEKMNTKGYIIASRDIPPSVRSRILDSLKKMGAKEINLGDDLIIVHPVVYDALFKNLSRISIQDPIEASELMGEAKQLFQELVRTGILFFDFKKRRWVLA